MDRLQQMCLRLTHLPATHVQYTLLRYCMDGCRLNFLTRCSSAKHIQAGITRADGILCQTLGDILGTPLTPKQWDQARLPQRLGGLSIGSPMDLAYPGRVATIIDFVIRGPKILLLQEDLPLLPPDFSTVVQHLQTILGPEFEPTKKWLTDPSSALRTDAVHSQQNLGGRPLA